MTLPLFMWEGSCYRYDRIQRVRNGIMVDFGDRKVWIHNRMIQGRKVIIYGDRREISLPNWLARKAGLI